MDKRIVIRLGTGLAPVGEPARERSSQGTTGGHGTSWASITFVPGMCAACVRHVACPSRVWPRCPASRQTSLKAVCVSCGPHTACQCQSASHARSCLGTIVLDLAAARLAWGGVGQPCRRRRPLMPNLLLLHGCCLSASHPPSSPPGLAVYVGTMGCSWGLRCPPAVFSGASVVPSPDHPPVHSRDRSIFYSGHPPVAWPSLPACLPISGCCQRPTGQRPTARPP